ncbi:MAG: glutaredoxin family protein [Pseudomonadota bacterium]
MRSLLLGLTLAAAASAAGAGTLYKWVDSQGKVHYADTPPPASAKQKEEKKVGAAAPTAGMPFALRQAVQTYPVTLYTTDCGEICNSARQLLSKRGTPFTLKNAQFSAYQDELKQLVGAAEVPVLKVGGQTAKGFEASQWNILLDSAGYPREPAPGYRPEVKTPQLPKAEQVGAAEAPAAEPQPEVPPPPAVEEPAPGAAQ